MKPFQIILLAVFGFLAVGGLFLFATFGGFGASSNARVGQVQVWGTLSGTAMNSVLTDLMASDKAFSNVSYRQIDEAGFGSTLAEALASGVGPDLLLISQEQLTSQRDRLSVIPFSTLSERDFIDTYLPISEIFLSTEGTFGYPYVVDPMVLYYNRTLLAQGGAANPPTSWEAVTGFAEQLTRREGSLITQAVVPFGVYENVENARALVSLFLLQAGNPIVSVDTQGLRARLTSAGESTYGSTPAQSALAFYTQFADPAKTVYTWNRSFGSARQAFVAGQLMFYPGFASELQSIRASNPNLDIDMSAIPQPQTAAVRTTFARAYAFVVPRATDNPEGALLVAQTLTDASRVGVAAQVLSMAPAQRALLIPSQTDRYQPIYFREALTAKGWLSPSPATTDEIFNTMIGNITSGRVNVGQALQLADQALDAAI